MTIKLRELWKVEGSICPDIRLDCQASEWRQMSWMSKVWRKEAEDWGESRDEMPKGGKTATGREGGRTKQFSRHITCLDFSIYQQKAGSVLNLSAGKWGLVQPRPVANAATVHWCACVSLENPRNSFVQGALSGDFVFVFCFVFWWLLRETSTPGTVLCGTSINPPYSSANFQAGHNGRWKINKQIQNHEKQSIQRLDLIHQYFPPLPAPSNLKVVLETHEHIST